MKTLLAALCALTLLAVGYLSLSLIVLRPPRVNYPEWFALAAVITIQSVATFIAMTNPHAWLRIAVAAGGRARGRRHVDGSADSCELAFRRLRAGARRHACRAGSAYARNVPEIAAFRDGRITEMNLLGTGSARRFLLLVPFSMSSLNDHAIKPRIATQRRKGDVVTEPG